MNPANRLRLVRQAAGLTQVEVAAAWGRTQPQVTRVENANIDSLRIGTVRSYLEAVGSTLMLRAEPGTNRAGPDSVDLQGESTDIGPAAY